MAGGPSTPQLAAAVSDAGGLGSIAAGYRTAGQLREDVAATRALTARPFGVNLFAPPPPASPEPGTVARYAEALAGDAKAAGVALGSPRPDDDAFAAKVEMLRADPVAVVSFTFGLPPRETIDALRGAGSAVWLTVTGPEEARAAAAAGADALVAQGSEAGGHRGTFDDTDGAGDLALLALLQLVRAAVDLPLVAAGGIATGAGVAAALAGGASAAMFGTAFLRCPEARTSEPHRRALAEPGRGTAITRAFTGRRARGVRNRFMADHEAEAPAAYPEVHHLTAPLRARARETGDPEAINLWAGQAYPLAEEIPAGDLVRRLATEAAEALDTAARRLRPANPPR